MKTKLIRITRIESSELDPLEGPDEISRDEFETLPKYEPTPTEREAEMLLRIRGKEREVDKEMMRKSVDLLVEDDVYKEMLNIFKLYGVPIKLIPGGVEADIRDRMIQEG